MIILDTNVVSEIMRPKPDERVTRWLDQQPRTSIWTTSVRFLRFALAWRRCRWESGDSHGLLRAVARRGCEQRIASYDETAARHAAELAADRRRRGRPVELRDTMIAGIVLASHAKLATRNVKHFDDIASSVVNPWEA